MFWKVVLNQEILNPPAQLSCHLKAYIRTDEAGLRTKAIGVTKLCKKSSVPCCFAHDHSCTKLKPTPPPLL